MTHEEFVCRVNRFESPDRLTEARAWRASLSGDLLQAVEDKERDYTGAPDFVAKQKEIELLELWRLFEIGLPVAGLKAKATR